MEGLTCGGFLFLVSSWWEEEEERWSYSKYLLTHKLHLIIFINWCLVYAIGTTVILVFKLSAFSEISSSAQIMLGNSDWCYFLVQATV